MPCLLKVETLHIYLFIYLQLAHDFQTIHPNALNLFNRWELATDYLSERLKKCKNLAPAHSACTAIITTSVNFYFP